MEEIRTSRARLGNITSSEIASIMSNGKAANTKGKPYYTYIEECNMERRLGRPLSDDVRARALSWGTMLEDRAFQLLGTSYKICSSETITHPELIYWSGSPDLEKFDEGKTGCDIKCPLTLKSFCKLVTPLYLGLEGMEAMNAIRHGYEHEGSTYSKHDDGEKYYWQLVSNSILLNAKYAELIVYCPYKSELDEIREIANTWPGLDQHKYAWIYYALDDELPHLIDGFYKNLNIIRFEVPEADKEALIASVQLAGKSLITLPQPELITT